MVKVRFYLNGDLEGTLYELELETAEAYYRWREGMGNGEEIFSVEAPGFGSH
ncbi:MAG: hypothetical protein K6T83_03760 [Alicyclobacillus sp.]|nr:hypothetical protein [Alicyclobacillus sp.]